MKRSLCASLSMLAAAVGQQVGKDTAETHPRMTWQKCTAPGRCSNVNGEVTIDANWRWVHDTGGYTNCYEGNSWNTEICSTNADCAKKCAVEGVNYSKTYGISTSGNALTLKFVQKHDYGTNVGSRMYLMNGASKYQMFTLMNNEFAFDVDLSTVGCGLNSALYFVAMKEDGGMSSESNNKAGAKYGTGYCDAQCARDLKFVGGQANIEGWKPSDSDANAGVGKLGACCAEIDIWESNSQAFAFTPHPCENNNYHVCEDKNCGGTYSEDRFAGGCDANGCDFNPYRMGNPDFYGPGKTIDTKKKFTVISRFEPGRQYQILMQDGRSYEVPGAKFDGIPGENAHITPEFCEAQFRVFDDRDRFNEVGGFTQLDAAVRLPMVLVMSIWADHHSNMLWLDSIYPPEKEGQPGSARGPCPQDSGVPDQVISEQANAKVVWSNVRFGPIGSTYQI
ncbi:cellulose 1,4-beta-cellobiosidase [Magnaporthiopsis poae ATCC 64411]|uniref:Glucanase n=1 Tax=Magnaporthiopsis poae (strain ATCC 64411 / 73-15) TaxID=644358 RepID=A0A0C4DNY4_MAGP6|nr:cellulose 1,4-beta-cellobiosidase [Magnaporthiopsis poae ATCC 64411]